MNLIKTQNPWFPAIVDELFNSSWRPAAPHKGGTLPAVNIIEEDKAYQLEFAVPGKDKNDFEIEVEDGVLSVGLQSSETQETLTPRYTRREFHYDAFKRTFTLPDSIDANKIDAQYRAGVLQVTLPKRKEALPVPKKKISIN